MLIHEANNRLETPITEEQLDKVDILYRILNLDKAIFCKMVDAVGIEVLMEQEAHYLRYLQGYLILQENESYHQRKQEQVSLKEKIEKMESERREIESRIKTYEEKFLY